MAQHHSITLSLRADGTSPSSKSWTFNPPIMCTIASTYDRNFNKEIVEVSRKEWEIAITSCQFINLIYNITEKKGNNLFKYNNGEEDREITFPDGQYSVFTFNAYLHDQMRILGDSNPIDPENEVYKESFNISIAPFMPNGRIQIDVKGDYQVQLEDGMAEFLGFPDSILDAGTYWGSTDPQFVVSTTYCIHCNVVASASYQNNRQSDILLSFVPTGGASSIVSITPEQPIYMGLDTERITNISLQLTDSNGRLLDLAKPIEYVVHLRRRER